MELLPPKLSVLPPFDQLDVIVDEQKLWEIDSPSLEWSLGMAYLLSNVNKVDFENVLLKLFGFEEMPKMNDWILQTKNSCSKYNPFKNRYAIYSDRNMRKTLENIKVRLRAVINLNQEKVLSVHLLKAATKLFKCVIFLFGVEPGGECQYISIYNNDNISMNDSLKIVIFQRAAISPTNELDSNVRFGFGLSWKYCQPLRHSSVVHFLKTAKLPNDKILQIGQAGFSDTSLLKCLFEAGCEDIIPSIYRSPYLVLRISEAGFDTDPCTVDDSGLSSFYYSIGLPKCDLLNILYHFATNNLHLTDFSVRNPDTNILHALEKVENVIKNDCLSSNNFQLLNMRKDVASKRCQEILFFNKYQRDICKLVYDLKKDKRSMDRNKRVMVSILETYNKYLSFDSISFDDDLKLFENFVSYSEYHENLDNFNCLLFFENISVLIPLISTGNSNIFYDAISSLFLSVLSNEFFPKYRHEIDCNNCELSLDECEHNHNSRRFIPFHYRTCFLKNAEIFASNLTISTSKLQKEPASLLLDILRKSLSNLPEIVDEFIVTRLLSYLEVAKSMQLQESPIKRMLTMERALQVVGEIFGNETVCKSVVRTLLQSCVPVELVNKLCCMRDNILSHYRKNAVNGRLKIEKDIQIVDHIQVELSDIDENFLPVYISQIFRVKECLAKEGKIMSQKFERIHWEMDTQLKEFINKRKPLCRTQEVNFEYILFNIFQKLYDNLENGNNNLSKSVQTGLEALIFLLNFIPDHCNNIYSSELTTSANELKEIMTFVNFSKGVSDEIIDKIKKFTKSHLNILVEIFEREQEEPRMNANFPCILSLNDKIKNIKIFNAKEKRTIKRKVLEYVNNSTALIRLLTNSLGKRPIVDLNTKLECLIIPEKKLSILAHDISKNTQKGFKQALKILKENLIENEDVEKLCTFDDNMDMLGSFREREELMNMLLKIKFPKMVMKKITRILNSKLWFLIDRIEKLKIILISEDENLSGLWRSQKRKLDVTIKKQIEKQMKYLMMQRYMREKDLQASLEMLLFDCMNILEEREDLKKLWEKTNDLFRRANIADVLAHGNTILQNVGSILSPEDLPSEFIEKILELIKDVDSIRALSEMWKKTKLCKRSTFFSVVESKEIDEHVMLRTRIIKCSRWKGYANLLPLQE